MSAPAGYTRSTFVMRADYPVTEDVAAELVGSRLALTLREAEVSSGTITDVRVVDDGIRLKFTVESQGRWCPVCGHIYSEVQAEHWMSPLAELRRVYGAEPGGLKTAEEFPGWVWVCRQWAACERRRMNR